MNPLQRRELFKRKFLTPLDYLILIVLLAGALITIFYITQRLGI